MAKVSNNDIARAIYLATKGKTGGELSSTLKKVVTFLANKRLLSKNVEILSLLKNIINKESGIVTAKISSVEKLSHKTKEDLTHYFKKRYKASEVILEEKIENGLLGGFRAEIDDEVIDGSIKNKIGKLQEYLARQ
jgi:F-type H+-transporting ATPase subunit delta